MELLSLDVILLIMSLPLWVLVDWLYAKNLPITWSTRLYCLMLFLVFLVISHFFSGKSLVNDLATQSFGFGIALLLLKPFAGKFFPSAKKSSP